MKQLNWTLHPAEEEHAPTILILPGGAYRVHAEHEGVPIARWLNSLGIHAAVLHYSTGDGCWPLPLLEARTALAELRSGECLSTDVQRVGVLGSSAGGHLAGLLATDTPDIPNLDPATFAGNPDIAMLCYPVTSLEDTINGKPNLHTDSGTTLLGAQATPKLKRELTIPHRVGKGTQKFFIWTTRNDERVPYIHTTSLLDAFDAAGIDFEGHVFRDGCHGLGLASEHAGVRQWTVLAECWLRDLGWTN